MKKNPFDIFNTADAELISVKEHGVYSKTKEYTPLGTVKADIQPYSSSLAEQEYGLRAECTRRMFCGDSPEPLKVGLLVKYQGGMYRITAVLDWEFGWEVLLDGYIG